MTHRFGPAGFAFAVVAATSAALAAEPAQTKIPADLPIGVSRSLYAIFVPPGSEPTPEKVKLGELLFNDVRLSANDKVSCATCHDPKKGFVDGKTLSVGIDPKKPTSRNSPTVLNAMFLQTQFWDGRAGTLEDQSKLPITNPIEMGMKDDAAVVAKVKSIAEYPPMFKAIYNRDVTIEDIQHSIASFERMQFSGNAPFDRFIQGDRKAISDSAKRGWALFNGKGRCNSCHQGNAVQPLFTDSKFHNIGIAAHKTNFEQVAMEGRELIRLGDQAQIDRLAIESDKFTELGRFLVTKKENDIGAFKTAQLRNIGLTAPYMHDGSLATLWDVVDHYNKGGVPNRFLDGGMQRLGLTEPEINDLVAFMFTLNDDKFAAFGKSEQARQTKLKSKRPQRDVAVAMGKKGHLGDLAATPDKKNPAEMGSFGQFPVQAKTEVKK